MSRMHRRPFISFLLFLSPPSHIPSRHHPRLFLVSVVFGYRYLCVCACVCVRFRPSVFPFFVRLYPLPSGARAAHTAAARRRWLGAIFLFFLFFVVV